MCSLKNLKRFHDEQVLNITLSSSAFLTVDLVKLYNLF